eukprot:SAG31_NODE_1811_length_7219_cov_1.768118_2_plen_283_part_00
MRALRNALGCKYPQRTPPKIWLLRLVSVLIPVWIPLRSACESVMAGALCAPPQRCAQRGGMPRPITTEQQEGALSADDNASGAQMLVSCFGQSTEGALCWDGAVKNFSLRVPELQADWQSTGGFSQALGVIPEEHVRQMREEAMRGFGMSHRKGIVAPSKSQSQGYDYVKMYMPAAMALYKNPVFIKSLEEISGRKQLMLSADSDPHAAVVYYYAQPGDFIGWHYDTSFYYGERLTVLVPLFDNSTCELQVEFMARDLDLERQEKEVSCRPSNNSTDHHSVI